MRKGLDGRTIFSIFLFVACIGVLIYWFVTRPTPQEKAITGFFDYIRLGNAEEAGKYLVNSSFGDFLFDSEITDSDGKSLKEGLKLDKGTLENLARDNIPYARGRVFKFVARHLQTQKSESDPTIAFVQFEYSFDIKEALDRPGNPGTIKGAIECRLVNGKWLLKRGDMKISIVGITLRRYWEDIE